MEDRDKPMTYDEIVQWFSEHPPKCPTRVFNPETCDFEEIPRRKKTEDEE